MMLHPRGVKCRDSPGEPSRVSDRGRSLTRSLTRLGSETGHNRLPSPAVIAIPAPAPPRALARFLRMFPFAFGALILLCLLSTLARPTVEHELHQQAEHGAGTAGPVHQHGLLVGPGDGVHLSE